LFTSVVGKNYTKSCKRMLKRIVGEFLGAVKYIDVKTHGSMVRRPKKGNEKCQDIMHSHRVLLSRFLCIYTYVCIISIHPRACAYILCIYIVHVHTLTYIHAYTHDIHVPTYNVHTCVYPCIRAQSCIDMCTHLHTKRRRSLSPCTHTHVSIYLWFYM